MTTLERPALTIALPIHFRIATHQDLPKLEWYGQYTHYRNLFRRAYREQQLGKRLMLLADSNGFPIGHIFIVFTALDNTPPEDRRAYLYSLRVMEMFRGCGIGTELLREAETLIADRNYASATIAAAKTNPRARKLYERIGYQFFADDPGRWSYVDHEGHTRHVQEPCWLLQKEIKLR